MPLWVSYYILKYENFWYLMSSYAQSIFIYVYNPVPVCAQPFIFHAAFYSAFYREAIQNVQCFKSMTSTKKTSTSVLAKAPSFLRSNSERKKRLFLPPPTPHSCLWKLTNQWIISYLVFHEIIQISERSL